MNKHQRLRATLSGEPVDRPPVALWRHFPVDDQRPADLAAAVLEWQSLYDWDFVKVTPESGYFLKGWGLRDEWRGEPEGTRQATGHVIQRPDDWLNLAPLDPDAPAGTLADTLRALEMIRDGLNGHTPFIQTIFSPISQARKLVGPDQLAAHVRLYPDEVRFALGVITETTLRYLEAAKRTGMDGIFYALQFASTRVFSRAEYREFGEPYDRQILEATQDLWLNVAHLHGEDVLFEVVARYPVQVLNWHDTETPPTLVDGQQQFAGAACGGIRQWETMVRGTPEQVRAEARSAIEVTGGRRFILGTGCVTPTTAPRANLRAARESVN